MAAFGKPLNTIYRFDRANVIVSLDADFCVRECRAACAMRAITARDGARPRENPSVAPPRLYVAEGTPSITGGMAEHRFRMRTSEVEALRGEARMNGTGDPRAQQS